MNTPLRVAAKALARVTGERQGLAGKSLQDHIMATWESHTGEVCAVLDAVSQNIGRDPLESERFAGVVAEKVRESGGPSISFQPEKTATAARYYLYAIRNEGPRE